MALVDGYISRGIPTGAMTPLMENGGDSNHLPWCHNEQTVDVYRYFATLHSEVVLYIFSYGVKSHPAGISIIRGIDREIRQHCLGEEIFVSTITEDTTERQVSFLKGARWID